MSAQRFVYDRLTFDEEKSLIELIHQSSLLPAHIAEKAQKEIVLIEQTNDLDDLFQLLRKRLTSLAHTKLQKRVLLFGNQLMPQLIDWFIRSSNPAFIENAVAILARSQTNYTAVLCQRYAEIKSPYVESMVCLLLGLRGELDLIPFLIACYTRLSTSYPDQTYHQGPLVALHELRYRFYGQKN